MTDVINATDNFKAPVRKAERKAAAPGKLDWFDKKLEAHKFLKFWETRNLEHGEVLVEMLELEVLMFQQNIFIEESKEIVNKLTRTGFAPLETNEYTKQFLTFSHILYNKKYNIAINLYDPSARYAIHTAVKIATKSVIDSEICKSVFLNAVSILMESK